MKHAHEGDTSSEGTLGQAIISGLEDMRDALRDGEKLHHRFTMRTVELELEPVEFVAEDIRRIRELFSTSQKVFAMLMGVKASTLQSWEQGRSSPPGPARRLLELMEQDPDTWHAMLESSVKTRSAS